VLFVTSVTSTECCWKDLAFTISVKGETIELSPVAEDEAYHFVFLLTLLTHSMEQRIPLEKLTGSQLVKNFAAFYGTRRFVTAFIRAFFLNDS